MKLSPQGAIDFDAVFRYLSDRNMFPKVERERVKLRDRDDRIWIWKKTKEEE